MLIDPSVRETFENMYPIFRYFRYEHLPERLQAYSRVFHDVAWHMIEQGKPGNPELAAGLRKLLEAKDCFVRSML